MFKTKYVFINFLTLALSLSLSLSLTLSRSLALIVDTKFIPRPLAQVTFLC